MGRVLSFDRVGRHHSSLLARESWRDFYRRFRCAARGVARCHKKEDRHVSLTGSVAVAPCRYVEVVAFWAEARVDDPRPIIYRPGEMPPWQDSQMSLMLCPATRLPTTGGRRAAVQVVKYRRQPSRLPDAGRPYDLRQVG